MRICRELAFRSDWRFPGPGTAHSRGESPATERWPQTLRSWPLAWRYSWPKAQGRTMQGNQYGKARPCVSMRVCAWVSGKHGPNKLLSICLSVFLSHDFWNETKSNKDVRIILSIDLSRGNCYSCSLWASCSKNVLYIPAISKSLRKKDFCFIWNCLTTDPQGKLKTGKVSCHENKVHEWSAWIKYRNKVRN